MEKVEWALVATGALVALLVMPSAAGTLSAGTNPEGLDVSQAPGAPGLPLWQKIVPPSGLIGSENAGEPTIGIPWDTDDVFYKARVPTYRISLDDGVPATATWHDVTPAFYVTDVDPMLHADPVTNRIWSGGLAGPCSLMAYSDDNGASWLPTGNMCTGAQFDHQSIGSGPWKDPLVHGLVYERALHYCAQLALTACTTSHDGGVSWGPWTYVLGACGGLHGHIRVSEVSGTAIVPHKNCGGRIGFAVTEDDGLTWNSRTHPDAPEGGGFDPSAQFSLDSGWLYLAQANRHGAWIGLSKDEGLAWEHIGGGMDVPPATWLDVGSFHDPPIVRATFADVQAGDDDRVAFSFLGLVDLDGDGKGAEYADIHQCDQGQDMMVWHYYVAMSYDAGQTWRVQRASADPVQVGGIWLGQGGTCRNLLDFNDMDIDSRGRVFVAYSDGCSRTCDSDPRSGVDGYRSRAAALLYQATGRGLLAAHDLPGQEPPVTPPPSSTPTESPDEPVKTALSIQGLGNGTHVDAGPLAVEGVVKGPGGKAGSGRVSVLAGTTPLGISRVDAAPEGTDWRVPVNLSSYEGDVTLRIEYREGGTLHAHAERQITVTPEGTGLPAAPLVDLEVVAADGDQVRLRLHLLGSVSSNATWRLLVTDEVVREGDASQLPLDVTLRGLHGPVQISLVLVDGSNVLEDRETVSLDPDERRSPAAALPVVLVAVAFLAGRRRPA